MAQGGVGEGGGEVVLVLRVAVDGDAGLVFGAFVAVAVVGIVVFPLQLEGEKVFDQRVWRKKFSSVSRSCDSGL